MKSKFKISLSDLTQEECDRSAEFINDHHDYAIRLHKPLEQQLIFCMNHHIYSGHYFLKLFGTRVMGEGCSSRRCHLHLRKNKGSAVAATTSTFLPHPALPEAQGIELPTSRWGILYSNTMRSKIVDLHKISYQTTILSIHIPIDKISQDVIICNIHFYMGDNRVSPPVCKQYIKVHN